MKQIVLLISLLFLASCCHVPIKKSPPNTVYPEIAYVSADDYNCVGLHKIAYMRECLKHMTDRGAPLMGTAFWIRDDLIVTAQHVALYAQKDPRASLILTIDGEYHKRVHVEKWFFPDDHDVALGYVPEAPKHKSYSICADIYEGETATAYGLPPDLLPNKVKAAIFGVIEELVVFVAPIRSGFSGGPLVSNARQCVIGVSTMTTMSEPQISIGINAYFLQAFVDAYDGYVAASIPKASR